MTTPGKCSLLVVDDEPYLLPTPSTLLAHGFEVITADSAEAAKDVFARREVDIILADQKMPRMTGMQLLEWVCEHSPKTVRLLMTGYAELEGAIEAINRGQVYHYLLKPWRTEELLHILRNARDRFLFGPSREQLALTDPLTGLLNRRAIDEAARAEVGRHLRYRRPLALGLIDADHFREINKRYLIPGGDEVLIALAKAISGSVRPVDTVGRVGGDEFLVLAPETDYEGALALAERMRSAVERSRITVQGEPVPVTVSVGFAVADAGANVIYDQLLHVACAALNEAKARGRNCAVIRLVRASNNDAA